MAVGTLVLHRFNGDEEFAIKSASLLVCGKGDTARLWFEIETNIRPLKTLPDTKELFARPNAEASVIVGKVDWAHFIGSRLHILEGYDEDIKGFAARLYYCEHDYLKNNEIKILERKGNKFHIRWTASATDVNYYDGSKPDTKVEIEAWFTFREAKKWLSAQPDGDN